MPTGIYKRTKKHSEAISNSLLGHRSWSKGKVFSTLAKKNMSNARKKEWKEGKRKSARGWHHKKEWKKEMSKKMDGRHTSPKTEFKKGHKGVLRNYKGGRTPILKLLRNSLKYKIWRLKVFERDNFMCQGCGKRSKKGEQVYLVVHHIKSFAKYPKLRFDVDNGITLCKDCHSLIHKRKIV